MPIYEYACGSCEHRFETIQRASEDPLRDCPECGDETLKKLLSAPVFRLKGSGWYETDFKTGDKKNVSDSGAGDESNGDDKAPATSNGEAKTNGEAKEAKSKPKETGGAEKTASSDSKAAAGASGAAVAAKSPAAAKDKH